MLFTEKNDKPIAFCGSFVREVHRILSLSRRFLRTEQEFLMLGLLGFSLFLVGCPEPVDQAADGSSVPAGGNNQQANNRERY